MNHSIELPAKNNHVYDNNFEFNYSRGVEFYTQLRAIADAKGGEDSEDDIGSLQILCCEYFKKSLSLAGSPEQQIKKIEAALILIEFHSVNHDGKDYEYYFYVAVDLARRYLGEDFYNTPDGKKIIEVYLTRINPLFKSLFHATDTGSFGVLLHLIIITESNKRTLERLQEAENFQHELQNIKNYGDASILVRIEELFGPIRLQILSEESDEIVVRHGFRSRDLAYGDMVSNTIWHTIVNIFDKPKRYSVTLDRGSDDSVNQFESHQLEKWIKPIINAYIERRERKFFLYVLDNNSTLELYEKNLTFPLIQYDYRPFITRVINECIHPLEFHESREDGQYVDDFLKAIDICRHLVIGEAIDLPQIVDTILGGKRQRKVLMMAKAILISRKETMNGTGYPFGLSKKRIPLESKLYSIIRAYEVLGSMSKSKQVEATMKAWASEGGGYFDHKIFSIFTHCMDKNGLLPKLQTNSTQLPPVSTDRKNFYEGHIATWNSIIKIIETIEHCYTDGRELEGDFSSQSAVLLEVSRLKRSLRQLTNNRTHIVLSRHCEADGNPALPGAIDELLTLKGTHAAIGKGAALEGLQLKIHASPIARASQTAAIVCQGVRGCILDITPVRDKDSYVIPSCHFCPGVTSEVVVQNPPKNIDNDREESYAGKLLADNTVSIKKFLVDLVSSPEESTHLFVTHRDSARHIIFWLNNLFVLDGTKGTKNDIKEDALYEFLFQGVSLVDPGEIGPNTLIFSLTDWKILVDAINLQAQAIFREPFCDRNTARVNLIALHDSFLDWMDEKREKSPKEYAQFIEGLNRDASTADIAKLLKLAGI